MNPVSNRPNANVLNSWKEIASYLGRGTRTVQRWERELQLPVHRIGVSSRSPVFAFEHELRFWLRSTDLGELHVPVAAVEKRAMSKSHIARSLELTKQLMWSAQENRRLLNQLASGLEKLRRARMEVRKTGTAGERVRTVTNASVRALAHQAKGPAPRVTGTPIPAERSAAVAS